MLEDETISCPTCDKEVNVKVLRQGRNMTYLVPEDCPNCKMPASKIERELNSMGKRSNVRTEGSYLKGWNKPK